MTTRVPMQEGCANVASACGEITEQLVQSGMLCAGKRYEVGANASELSKEQQTCLQDFCRLLNLLEYMSEGPFLFCRWICNCDLQINPFIKKTMATLIQQEKTQFGEFGGMYFSWKDYQWQEATDILVGIITKNISELLQ